MSYDAHAITVFTALEAFEEKEKKKKSQQFLFLLL